MRLSRRRFLQGAAAAAIASVPAAFGYDLYRDAQGELPPSLSPYAPSEVMPAWPARPEEASPILLLVSASAENPFGPYLGEILRAEGLNCYQVADLATLDDAPLDWYDTVLLAEMELNSGQLEQLTDYVVRGGCMIAMRPGESLDSLLGVHWTGGATSEGYLQVDPTHPVGQGIALETLQFHGTASHYELEVAEAVAWLSSTSVPAHDYPAVTLHRVGDGWVSLWAFDLARSIAYTRQGNPAWANQERDGGDGIRTVDMFAGWIDLERIHIPQADEQQRLLVSLIAAMSQGRSPLPRLWYFPGAANAVLVATSDSHGNPASAVEDLVRHVEQRGGHISIYYTPFPNSRWRRAAKRAALGTTGLPAIGNALSEQFASPTSSHVADWRERGHEFGLHPYVEQGLEVGWGLHWREFTGLGYGPVPPTTRTHRILWTGWVETARRQAEYGIRMNLDYYHWGPTFRDSSGQWVNGHLTASGLPMRFVDERGAVLSIYQQPTQLADDHLMNLRWGAAGYQGYADLDPDAATEVSNMLLAQSSRDHSAISANFHADQYHVDPIATDAVSHIKAATWLGGTLDFAVSREIPILSAVEWLRFVEARDSVRFQSIDWKRSSSELAFTVQAPGGSGVETVLMVPWSHDNATLLELRLGDLVAAPARRTIGGLTYGWVLLPPGHSRTAVVARYG